MSYECEDCGWTWPAFMPGPRPGDRCWDCGGHLNGPLQAVLTPACEIEEDRAWDITGGTGDYSAMASYAREAPDPLTPPGTPPGLHEGN